MFCFGSCSGARNVRLSFHIPKFSSYFSLSSFLILLSFFLDFSSLHPIIDSLAHADLQLCFEPADFTSFLQDMPTLNSNKVQIPHIYSSPPFVSVSVPAFIFLFHCLLTSILSILLEAGDLELFCC